MYFEPKNRPAGAFWADKIVFCQKVVPQGPFGQTKLSPQSRAGGTEGEPEALSQPVDPGEVGGLMFLLV